MKQQLQTLSSNSKMMQPRRSTQVFESLQLMNTPQIFRESIRILLLLHSTHFHSISVFLFSPLPLSLFFSHFLIHHYHPQIIPSSTLQLINYFIGPNAAEPILKFLSKTIVHIIICFPSSITFSLLGKAATIHAVSDSYNGISLSGRRLLFMRSGFVWVKLLHTCFWEFLILLVLFAGLVVSLAIFPKILFICGVYSTVFGFWVVLVFLGVPFCVGFAHIMVVGNLAKVLAVLEGDCYGFKSLVKSKSLIEGRKQTVLVMALFSNLGLRLVEFLFEFRLCVGMSIWEGPILVSMYSLVLVLETLMNVVFYYTCKA